MTTDIKELAKRLRAIFTETRAINVRDVHAAADTLEALVAERDRLKAALEAKQIDPAPVCVWEVDGRNLWFAWCQKQMGHRSYSQPPSHCHACKALIMFTEDKK